jgi:UDP-glucuronate 4-epimerase
VVDLVERALARTTVKELVAMQPGEIAETCGDIDDLRRAGGFTSSTPIEDGLARSVSWHREFYHLLLKSNSVY